MRAELKPSPPHETGVASSLPHSRLRSHITDVTPVSRGSLNLFNAPGCGCAGL